MSPLLKEGMLVPFKSVSFSSLAKGDIAILKLKDSILIHRVIDKFKVKDKAFIVHKGDISPTPLVIPSDSLVGKVVMSVPYLTREFAQGFILKLKVTFIRFKLILKDLVLNAGN